MNADEPASPGFSLRRWSQRKLAAARAASETAAPPAAAAPLSAGPGATASGTDSAPVTAAAPGAALPAGASATQPAGASPEEPAALPPVESLTIDSDFTAFLQPKVDEALKRQALKQLFRDPRFNVMDGLDVYIDDYTKPDPIAPELVRQLAQARYIFDPPATRVNAQGEIEDVPPEASPEGVTAGEPAPAAGAGSDVPAEQMPPTLSDSTPEPERPDAARSAPAERPDRMQP